MTKYMDSSVYVSRHIHWQVTGGSHTSKCWVCNLLIFYSLSFSQMKRSLASGMIDPCCSSIFLFAAAALPKLGSFI